MLMNEKDDNRPLFRPKGFNEEERRLIKIQKFKQWHKGEAQAGIVAGAPLIICPSAGDSISKKMKDVCRKFKEEHKIEV